MPRGRDVVGRISCGLESSRAPVVVPDNVPDVQIDPLHTCEIRKASLVNADVIACHASDFAEARNTPNTMAYEVTHGGVLIYER